MPNDDSEKKSENVDITSLAKGVASIFAGGVPGIGTVWRGMNTAKNVTDDIKRGEYGRGAAEMVVGTVENNVATAFGQVMGAAARHGAGSIISTVAGEQYRPEESRVVSDAKTVVAEARKIAPKP